MVMVVWVRGIPAGLIQIASRRELKISQTSQEHDDREA